MMALCLCLLVALVVVLQQRAPRRRLSLQHALQRLASERPPRPLPPVPPPPQELGEPLPFDEETTTTRPGRPAPRQRRTCRRDLPVPLSDVEQAAAAILAGSPLEHLETDSEMLAALPLPPPPAGVPQAIPVPVPTGRLGEALLTPADLWPLELHPTPRHRRDTRETPAAELQALTLVAS